MIHSLIDHFLNDHRGSDGGWANITPEDMNLLQEIIQELIRLKCDKDADGDLPIEFVLVNRRTHEPMHFDPVPYREQHDEKIPSEQMMRILMLNLGIAYNRLDSEFRIWQHRRIDK